MSLSPSFQRGTVSVSNGGTVVSGVGTGWLAGGIIAGDVFCAEGLTISIDEVTADGRLELAFPWPGPTLGGASYEIRITPDASRVAIASLQAIIKIAEGDFISLSEIEVGTAPAGSSVQLTGGVLMIPRGKPGALNFGEVTVSTGAPGSAVTYNDNTGELIIPAGRDGDVSQATLTAAINQQAQEQESALQSAIETQDNAREAVLGVIEAVRSEDRTVSFVGASGAVIDQNPEAPQANTVNWVFPSAVAVAGDIARFRGHVAVAGLVHLGIYRRVGDFLIRQEFRAIFLPAGYVDVPVGLWAEAGDFVGAYMGSARLRFQSGGGLGYYYTNVSGDQSSIPVANFNLTNLLLAQFVIYEGLSASGAANRELSEAVDDLATRVVRLEYGGRDLEEFGTTDLARLADPGPSPAAEWNFVFDKVRPAGPIVEVEFYSRAAGTFRLKTGVIAGGSFSTRQSVTLDVVEGHNIIPTNLEMREGEMLGYKSSVRMVPFQTNSPLGTETGTWYNGSTTDLESFPVTLNPNQQHLVKFKQAIGATEGGSSSVASTDLAEARVSDVTHVKSGNDLTVNATIVGIAGTATTASAQFSIPVASADFRYDLIVYDHGLKTFSRLVGGVRNDAANIQPGLTGSSQQAVLRVRVGTAGITSVVPIPEMSGAVPLIARDMVDRRISEARRRCPKLMSKIYRRQPIRIMGLGDSISALGTGGSKSAVNGSVRDIITGPYLTNSGIVAAAAISAIPLFTAVELGRADDGAGRVHSRVGINWELVRGLEARGWVLGSDLFYDNFAIPGTSSTDLWDDATDAPTSWLAAVPTAGGSKPDVVIYANAMNERPYAAGREERNRKIVNWIRSQGIEVIITTCARASKQMDDTRHANERLARVARFTGSGLIPLEAIWEDSVVGALGLNPEDVCLANRSNHPGVLELTRYGAILAEILP